MADRKIEWNKPVIIKYVISALVFWLLWSIGNFLLLPVYSIQSVGTWFYVMFVLFLIGLGWFFIWREKKIISVVFILDLGILALLLIFSIPSWLIWFGNDQKYQSLIAYREKSAEDFAAQFTGGSPTPDRLGSFLLPTIDKELSISLAMGKMGPYGAQFVFNSEIFSAVNVNFEGRPRLLRISPLEYASEIVAFNLANQGTAGYIQVDQISGEAKLVEVPGGLKYLPSGFWNYSLERHLRNQYPSAILGDWAFEIDDNLKPWWVVPVIQYTVGLFGGADVAALILVDPVSGETQWYELGQEPAWVDRVYPSQLILEQSTDYFSLKQGWFNVVFGPMTGVFQPSDSYTYVAVIGSGGGATYLVSGVTSPNESDQTSIGVMMVNLKNKESLFFKVGGITEMRAIQIAVNDERVRAQNLQASWPILVPINGRPTYYLILKNDFQRQRFVLIEASSGTPVSMAETYEAALSQYVTGIGFSSSTASFETTEGVISRLRRDGATLSFLLTGDNRTLYIVSENLNYGTRFLQPNDQVQIKFRATQANERVVIDLVNMSLR